MNPAPSSVGAAVQRLILFYEHLGPSDVPRLGQYYAADARFRDPFHEVQGVAAIERIFHRMFATLHEPRFVITGRIVEGAQCFLLWEFRFRMRPWLRRGGTGPEQVVRGSSHIVFDAQGRVCLHRDYWDAAEELYGKLPVLGALMRWCRRAVRGH